MTATNIPYPKIISEIKEANYGDRVLILPDTFLLKVAKFQFRIGNSYIIRHVNRKEILLIDVVHESSKNTIDQFISDGYDIQGLLLTHGDLIDQAYTNMTQLSKDLNNAPIYIHPLDSKKSSANLKDITQSNPVFDEFLITVYHTPGHTEGSVLIHSSINNGMLFTGDSAVGGPYHKEEFYFERPPIEKMISDQELAGSWQVFDLPFTHLLPLHGKPEFNLSEERQNDILINLSKNETTESL
ncbi:hypothetical protein NBT05_08340 [Aquimarina sp. ERC-38]|uniref:MBL fold metallo-hydrolase n=1 Tax=Aquimarina sp. ERC-38 TaxID=2949996 RepID=UPI00224707F1|nr:MBL fold metallo-hydrolase [Aquimarina sp. ERC-38]UZO82470.1 hypothetical protein NBT05_08340 [Aquimarina sp. ERC-38]